MSPFKLNLAISLEAVACKLEGIASRLEANCDISPSLGRALSELTGGICGTHRRRSRLMSAGALLSKFLDLKWDP